MNGAELIAAGRTSLGLELGSTRIKAVLIGPDHSPLASGSHDWQSRLIDGNWTYSVLDIWSGLRACYRALAAEVAEKYGVTLTTVGSIGVSAMMHGYLAFDHEKVLLTPFRTWQNTSTGPAAAELSRLFGVNIPQRWSIAHLYQAILNGEEHLPKIDYLTTLAGYVHWRLTGFRSLGVGDASGMFPIDPTSCQFHAGMVEQFDALVAEKGYPWRLMDILPEVLAAGDSAGCLTAEGARMLDTSGNLQPGIPLCPPEGDAGTGMCATNSVAPRTGNVSAGTSVFSMAVLEKPLSAPHPELDIVTTPEGREVAMVHCNNGTGELNAWMGMFGELAALFGADTDKNELYTRLFRLALAGDADCGGLAAVNYLAGEPVTGFTAGRPLFVRRPEANFSLANFMRSQLYAALAALAKGNEILRAEGVTLDKIYGHGGYFKTPGVGQRFLAAALETPVAVMASAGEGGPWGMALLAAFPRERAAGESLSDFLANQVFRDSPGETLEPDPAEVAGFRKFLDNYTAALKAEQAAVASLTEDD